MVMPRDSNAEFPMYFVSELNVAPCLVVNIKPRFQQSMNDTFSFKRRDF